MINIPIEVGAHLTTGGIEIHSWVGDYDGDGIFYSWSTLVRELVEGYNIPTGESETRLSPQDYDHLVEVLQDLQGAANMLLQRLDDSKVVW